MLEPVAANKRAMQYLEHHLKSLLTDTHARLEALEAPLKWRGPS
jgi:hypothetical protein